MNTRKDYLKSLQDNYNYNQLEVAAKLNISSSHYSNIINSKKNISYKIAQKLMIIFPIIDLNRLYNLEGK